jgi:antitoxin ParD1/3/4
MITATIPAEFEPFIEHQVAMGRYRSAQEVVSDALRLLRKQGMDTLRQEIQVGIDELDRGEEIVIDDEKALKRFFDGIETEGRKEIEAERAG